MNSAAEATQTIRVLIVDDEPDLRVLLRTMLSIDQRFEVVGEAADGGEGLEMFRSLRPDVLVLDQRMPVLDGLTVAGRVIADDPDQTVILMSAFLNDEMISEAAALGVSAVIGKQNLADIIEDILRLTG